MKNRGIALIITLTLVVLVVSVVINLSSLTWVDVSESAVFRDKIISKANLISLLNFAIAVLSLDRQTNNYDSFNDLWADREELNKRFSEWSGAEVDILITDSTGKLNINSLVKANGEYNDGVQKVLLRLLKGPVFQLSDEQAQDLLDSIKDWLDKDEEPTRFGAESGYYKENGLEYGAKNGPIDFLEELLMIKGMTKEIFYGKEGRPGLRQFLRLKGTERVNINTAPAEILMALGENVPWEGVEAMLSYRAQKGTDLSNVDWYRSVPGMAGVELDSNMITIRSDLFETTLTFRTPAKRSQMMALLERYSGGIRILDSKME